MLASLRARAENFQERRADDDKREDGNHDGAEPVAFVGLDALARRGGDLARDVLVEPRLCLAKAGGVVPTGHSRVVLLAVATCACEVRRLRCGEERGVGAVFIMGTRINQDRDGTT